MSKDTSADLRFNQVALSVCSHERSLQWYRDVLGYLPAGELVPYLLPEDQRPDSGALQGLPGAQSGMTWAVDQQRFFQLEFFEYVTPEVRPLPADWRVCDVGYSLIAMHVVDFDATIARARAAGSPPMAHAIGVAGDRRVCVRDPDGVVIELMEADPRTPQPDARPRPGLNVVARGARATVRDLSRSLRFFVDTLGMSRSDFELHKPEHEALWGLADARRTAVTLWAGDLWLELVQYEDPIGAPWPAGYRISDQGLLNVALGTRTPETFRAVVKRVRSNGYSATPEYESELVEASYSMDDQGFSVELWYVDEDADPMIGLVPMKGEVVWS
jgi:catechol 2,3-dioxygenase-like lactoylglutathione lyase family enzyme